MAERYERTMSRLEQKTRAGYQLKVQWFCEFEEKADLLTHPVVRHTPLFSPQCPVRGRDGSHASPL